MKKESYFPLTSPESLGIDTKGILKFLNYTEYKGLELHRLMILRHGKCCSKVIWRPYSDTDMHPVYSFSKSLTATAIAFARQEGLLTLDERIIDLFPEDCPEEISENMAACTIHHLLCMSCGQETECEDQSVNWRKSFFRHPFLHVPGSFYKYNTMGTNLLAAIIKKKTGLQVTEYLRPRLFDPLGIGEVYCHCMDDDLNTQHGGGGMKLQLEDMAKFAQFMLQDGVWEGNTLLKDWYFDKAGMKQMETAGDSEGHVYDWAHGYGYQCWICNREGSFRADGAFGQFGLVYPDLDLCIITNAATEQTQTIMDLVNEYILTAVDSKSDLLDNFQPDGNALVEERNLMPLSSCRNPLMEEMLNQEDYQAKESGMCSFQQLVGGAGCFKLEDGEIEKIRFDFSDDRVTLHVIENGVEIIIDAGLERCFLYTEIGGIIYAATARWRTLRKLEMEIRRMDAMSGVRILFAFEENGENFKMEADETLMTDGGLGMVEKHLVGFRRL